MSKCPLHNIETSLLTQHAAMYHITPVGCRHMCMQKRVQMTQIKSLDINLLLFGGLIY